MVHVCVGGEGKRERMGSEIQCSHTLYVAIHVVITESVFTLFPHTMYMKLVVIVYASTCNLYNSTAC